MAETEKFDAIVVGAGPAGTTAAYIMAQSGMEVLLLERGLYPGAKNVFGGILYTPVLNRIMPEFWKDAPVERHVKGIRLFLISEKNAVSIGVESQEHNQPPYNNSFTVSRPRFDNWYAQQAQDMGVMLITDTVVDDLLWDGQKVVGVKARGQDGEVRADVVIAADGVNSLLTEKAGLRKSFKPRQVSLGIREVIRLPREVIEERFQLSGNEGIELKYLAGDATKGIWGGGNIYTNVDTLSVVTWFSVEPLLASRQKALELMDRFKEHPFVRDYIKGGEVIEYQAHLAPDGGYDFTPKYYTDGLLVAGDAARFLNASIHYEGTNFAMASGEAAAQTIIEAKSQGDFSAKTLSAYQERLNNSFVMKDLKRYRKLNRFADNNPEFFDGYFDAITQMAVDYFTVNELPKRRQEFNMLKRFRANLRDYYARDSAVTRRQNPLVRAFARMCPLIVFLWKCIKGGFAFV